MKENEELKLLSNEFQKKGHKLYIVGGFVRNTLMSIDSDDIDITSSLDVASVEKICKKLNFKCKSINPRLGTLQIFTTNNTLEYTRFRAESYSRTDGHSPSSVEFVDDIEIDILRRDFTVNCLYYDIEEDIIVDLVHGRKHLQQGILTTPQDPDKTLSDDGLRILRAIRFACRYNLKIHPRTLKSMITYAPLLKSISKERILKELSQIVVADIADHKTSNNMIAIINKCKLYKFIISATLSNMKGISKSTEKSFLSIPKEGRLIGFYIAVLMTYIKTHLPSNQLGYNINALLGLDGIKESKDNIHTTEKLFRIIDNLNNNDDSLNASINYLTLSNTERSIVEAFINKKAKHILRDNMLVIKDNKLPLSIHQLEISAQDLIDAGIEKIYISKILSSLYNQVLNLSVANDKKDLIKLAIEIHETFTKIQGELS